MLEPLEVLKRLKTVQAVILDMDGVLVDTEPLHMEAFARFLDQLNIPYDNHFLFSFIGFSVPDNIQMIYQKFLKINDQQAIAEGIKKRDGIYHQLLRSTPLTPLPGIIELCNFCQTNHLKMGLASSSDREQIEIIFNNLKETSKGTFNPYQIFTITLSGEDVEKRKPDPEIYTKACQKLQQSPQNCLTIEDSPAGVSSAIEAGLICFALKNHFVPEERLQHAHWVIDTVDQATALLKKALIP